MSHPPSTLRARRWPHSSAARGRHPNSTPVGTSSPSLGPRFANCWLGPCWHLDRLLDRGLGGAVTGLRCALNRFGQICPNLSPSILLNRSDQTTLRFGLVQRHLTPSAGCGAQGRVWWGRAVMHGFPTGHKSVGSPASDEGIVIYGI